MINVADINFKIIVCMSSLSCVVMCRSSFALSSATGLAGEDPSAHMPGEAPLPAVNLSNRLNPNNIHYDRVLAAQYKNMTKLEKEALWAQVPSLP